jgi:hypothetical protein
MGIRQLYIFVFFTSLSVASFLLVNKESTREKAALRGHLKYGF